MSVRPLDGIRVIELAGLGPGPFAGMQLADLGADVVRIDRPGGHGFRVGFEHLDVLNRGKRSVVLNLKDPSDRATLLDMVERADVLIEGNRPGVAERLGIGPDEALERNPRIVYGRMTGWGQSGPLARTAGHDLSYLAITGIIDAIGPADGPPQVPLNLIGDFGGGGMYLVTGVLAALLHAGRTGQGQVVDAAIVDGATNLLASTYSAIATGSWRAGRGSNMLDGGAPFYTIYETSDGSYVAVAAIETQFYAQLLAVLGIDADPREQHDRERWPRLRKQVAAAFRTRPRQHWVDAFAGSDACVAPVLTMEEAWQEPHLTARDTLQEVDGLRQPAPAPRFSATPTAITSPPPLPGQHQREVLDEWGVRPTAEAVEEADDGELQLR